MAEKCLVSVTRLSVGIMDAAIGSRIHKDYYKARVSHLPCEERPHIFAYVSQVNNAALPEDFIDD